MVRSYREYWPPPTLEPVVACLWENEPAEDRAQPLWVLGKLRAHGRIAA